MLEIVDSVKRVTDIMGEISTASAEQTSGIEQVNIAIGMMDSVTQQNAALVEQAAAAADALEGQAGNLARVVSVFKLDEGQAAAFAPRAPAPAVRKAAVGTAVAMVAKPAHKAPPRPAAAAAPKAAPKKAVTESEDGWEEF
jgi:methyl-accepting chemotaxis protein